MKIDISSLRAMIALLAPLALVPAASSTDITYDWRFGSSANPAVPIATGGIGSALATVAPGSFSDGWINTNAVLGAAQGVWDLGGSGAVTLNNASGLAGNSDVERLITVSVSQYQDGGIYNQLAAVSVPGASLVSSNASTTGAGYIGVWTLGRTQWRAPAGVAVNAINISGVSRGSLIDSVLVESTIVTTLPQLTIRRVGPNDSQVEISWPASYTNMALQSAGTVNNPLGWTAVDAPVQVNGNVRFVTLDAAGAARFYRLKSE